MRKLLWQTAVEHLQATDNPAIMTGDHVLAHEIAEKHGMAHDGYHTERRVIEALWKTPGILVRKLTGANWLGGRAVRMLRLPEEADNA